MCAQLLLKFFPAAFERLPRGSRHICHVHTAKVYPEHAQCFAQLFSHSHVTKHKTAQLNTSKHINAHARAINTNTHEPTTKHTRAHKHAHTKKHTVAAEHKHRIVSKRSDNFSRPLPRLGNMRTSKKICAPLFKKNRSFYFAIVATLWHLRVLLRPRATPSRSQGANG